MRSRLAGAVLAAAALSAIALICCPLTVQPGDAGEFTTVMLGGGVAHPPGYPLMRLLGWVSQVLASLGVPPVIAAASTCAACGALSFFTIFLAWQRAVSQVGLTLLLAAAASSPVAIRHLYDAEVWGLHLLCCAVLLATLIRSQSRMRSALLFATAVAQHLTALAFLPWLLAHSLQGAIRDRRTGTPIRGALLRSAIPLFTGALFCLALYATLAVNSDSDVWRWGDFSNLSGWFHHISRGDYGTLRLSLHAEEIPALAKMQRHLQTLGEAFILDGVHAQVAGLLLYAAASIGIRYTPQVDSATSRWGYRATLLLAGPAFCLAGNISPTAAMGAWILERFDLLVYLLLTIGLLGAGIRLHALVAQHFGFVAGHSARFLGYTLALSLTCYAPKYEQSPAADSSIEAHAHDILETPEPGRAALIIGTDDHRTFPLLYLQWIAGLRNTDVTYIDAQLMTHAWYRDWLQRISAFPLPIEPSPLRVIGKIWDDRQRRHLPIYLTNHFSKPSERLRVVPEGILLRVIPPGPTGDEFSPDNLVRRHLAALNRYEARADLLLPVSPEAHSAPWKPLLWETYLRSTQQLAQLLADAGRKDLAVVVIEEAKRVLAQDEG